MRFNTHMRRFLFLATLLVSVAAAASDITRTTVLEQMNARRLAALLPPLRHDARLDLAAEDRMRDMEDQVYWAHTSPDGRSPFEWLRPRGYDYWFAGENLACGFETAEVLVDGWMESEGHRDNIMGPMFQECGIAIIDGGTVQKTAGKSIVVLFGRVKLEPQQARK
jgi:uncharacterized protein YkwD